MSQFLISSPERKELEKFSRFLCLKVAQVIIQGRMGKPISSECSPFPTGGEWFNLAIKDYPEVQREAKSALNNTVPSFPSSFVIEISLHTSDSESLVLEVWSLCLMKKVEDVRIHHAVYNRMSMILKSLMCVSRATPAYKLSRKQGGDYVICYRIYTGKTNVSGLGASFKTVRVGSIGTPNGTLALSVAFRTNENLHVSTKKLAHEGRRPMTVCHDHFRSHKPTATSPARPCHTLQSQLISSKEFSSNPLSSDSPLESPSYGVLPSSFSTSPCDQITNYASSKSAVFTIGTPPASNSTAKTPSPHGYGRRKLSDVSHNRGFASGRSSKPFMQSHSEQNLSYPQQQRFSQKRRPSKTAQMDTAHVRSKPAREESTGNVFKSDSMHSTLKNEGSMFRPISCSPLDDSRHSQSSTVNTDQIKASSVGAGLHNRSHMDSVTALKSNSPTNAKVGFPDNTQLTSHLAHIPPSLSRESLSSTPKQEKRSEQRPMHMPSPGAFVSNSKSAKRAFDSLNEVTNNHKLPFEDLISCGSGEAGIVGDKAKELDHEFSPEGPKASHRVSTRPSSQSSVSSIESTGSSPRSHTELKRNTDKEEFLMIDINLAFTKNDSATDLSTFYREIENVPDLVMFQESNGEETEETLLDLTKQLEDYQRDAVDFDDFIKELEATL